MSVGMFNNKESKMKVPIHDEFDVAAGSIIGTYHLHISFNNQDNYQVVEDPDCIIAVVCDGCGSGVSSEVGATLGSSMVICELREFGIHNAPKDEVNMRLELTRRFILNRIISVGSKVGSPFANVISDSFLFTIVAAIIGRERSYIVSIGDGFYAINGEVKEIGPFENNAPPYVAYGAIEEHLNGPVDTRFVVNEIIDTKDLDSLLIGTDGVGDLIKAEEKRLPGNKKLVGPLSQFWTDDLYFSNQAAISRRLAMINRSVTKIDRKECRLIQDHGHLGDDTTLVSVRKKVREPFQIL